MAITTYSELQAAVGNWLDHGLFAARIPEFIALFEAAANRRLRGPSRKPRPLSRRHRGRRRCRPTISPGGA